MSPERAEHIAILALTWLAGNEELFPVFLGSTGANVDELRAQAENRSFLIGVLEFVTLDDAWVIAFCDVNGLSYQDPLTARMSLPGAEDVHWT